MIDRLKSFFLREMAIPDEGAREDGNEALRVAACALLLEVAHADDYLSRGNGSIFVAWFAGTSD